MEETVEETVAETEETSEETYEAAPGKREREIKPLDDPSEAIARAEGFLRDVYQAMDMDVDLVSSYDGEVRVNPEEASQIRWIALRDLKEELRLTPERFSSWFIICAPKVIAEYEAAGQA